MHFGVVFTIAPFDWQLRYFWEPEDVFAFGLCVVDISADILLNLPNECNRIS